MKQLAMIIFLLWGSNALAVNYKDGVICKNTDGPYIQIKPIVANGYFMHHEKGCDDYMSKVKDGLYCDQRGPSVIQIRDLKTNKESTFYRMEEDCDTLMNRSRDGLVCMKGRLFNLRDGRYYNDHGLCKTDFE